MKMGTGSAISCIVAWSKPQFVAVPVPVFISPPRDLPYRFGPGSFERRGAVGKGCGWRAVIIQSRLERGCASERPRLAEAPGDGLPGGAGTASGEAGDVPGWAEGAGDPSGVSAGFQPPRSSP